MYDAHERGMNKYIWISSQRLDEKWKGDDKFWGMTPINFQIHSICRVSIFMREWSSFES